MTCAGGSGRVCISVDRDALADPAIAEAVRALIKKLEGRDVRDAPGLTAALLPCHHPGRSWDER